MANTTGLPVLFSAGVHGSRPSASAVGSGGLYACSTHSKIYQSDGVSTWTDWQTSPAAATRASLGLDTTDSPQFAGVNIGAATDTTVTRTGAGDIAVEGNALYRAGGTDVPIADGGTGSSTASAARTALGLAIGTDVDAFGAAAAVKGLPLALTGAVSATRYVGGTASVAPTTGTFAVGDFVITQAGGIYICTSAGSPGTWAAVTGGGGSALTVKDEGSNLDTAVTSLDFVGAGVVATNTGHAVTVTVSGGGGGSALGMIYVSTIAR